jgi:hypothetical protein
MASHGKRQLSFNYGGELPHRTSSLCPTCKRILQAKVFEENGRIWISRNCPEHGETKEVYYESPETYERFRGHSAPAKHVENPNVESLGEKCPFQCGLCSRHKSHTALANIAVTNRCDLRCWYCFYFAKEGQPVYEPSLAQIRRMLAVLKSERPVAPNAIQITGGEPLLRRDLVDVVKSCKQAGFDHIQLNTAGIRLASNPGLAKRLRKAGVNTLYLSFDGTTAAKNPKNHWEIPYILENCRKAHIGVVLVPTIIRGVNDDNLGEIINFALNNTDIVRGVNFQPVSLVGRMPKGQREKARITIPGALEAIEGQTGGAVAERDFYPVPCVHTITELVEAWTGAPQYDFSTHFACGAASYLFLEGDRVIPITRFVDVDGLFKYLTEKAGELRGGGIKPLVALKMLFKIRSFIDAGKQPRGLDTGKLIFNALVRHDYKSLGAFHLKTLYVGMMHFMDLYNYDVERVERCSVHYAMPDGRIVPFCAFNVLPEEYRDKVQREYSIPWGEWKREHGSLERNLYRRDVKKLEAGEAYKRTYSGLRNYFP